MARFSSKAEAERFLATVEKKCEQKIAYFEGVGEKRVARMWEHAARQLLEHRNPAVVAALGQMNRVPATLDEFVQSPEFLGELMEVWPTLMPDLRAMNPDVFVGEEPVFEALLGGATGTGKTHLSQITNMYQLYLFTCFDMPQRLFNLTVKTPIVILFQSVSTTITKRVIYEPFRNTFCAMRFTSRWVRYDKYKESTLELENGIVVAPAMANLQALVGQAIPGGILDEVNFMSIIEKSKQVAGAAGLGGHYDQAETVYRNISRRRKRSFLTKAYSMGTLCVVSSTRYKGDFLDRRIDEVRQFGEQNIVALRRKQYEVAPPGRYSGETFRVLIGTDDYATRVLEPDEEDGKHFPAGMHVEQVPVELRSDFLRDPEAAQRDYCGIASNAISPFIAQRDKVVDAILAGEEFGLRPWSSKQDVVLHIDGMPQINEANLPRDPRIKQALRFIHVDLSSSTDRCGIAVVRVLGQQAIARDDGLTEVLPVYAVEEAVSIQPSSTAHIDPSEVRQWIMRLVSFYGINVTSVSYDGYQSTESLLLLRRAGIRSQTISVDRTSEPYNVLRRALYDKRIKMVNSELLRTELSTLEYIASKDRIDHPPKGSKDVADAVCGALYAASLHRGVTMGTGIVQADGQLVRNISARQRPAGNMRPR
jgi:hypothetical protein